MQPNKKFFNQSPEFWATVKLLSQKLKYSKGGIVISPSIHSVVKAYQDLGLYTNKIYFKDEITEFGELLIQYFEFRAELLNTVAEPNFMRVDEAKELFWKLVEENKPQSPLPMNKQKGDKKSHAYLTGIVNMTIEKHIRDYPCKYDAKELTAFTLNKFPVRSLSRRVDGSFPNVINPIALWEIKEYYFTTSFGSRIADGVYESMLDGYELAEIKKSLSREVFHYLIIDAYDTWWKSGKSYLCRLVDLMHMGLLTECLIGKEVVTRLPEVIKEWINLYHQYEVLIDT